MSDQPVDTQPMTPEEFVEALRNLRQRVHEYVQLRPAEAKASRAVANLHSQFKEAAINAVGASPIVTSAVGMTADELHRINDEAERWTAAIDELKAFTKGITGTNLKRRHAVGLASLQSYSITRQLVRHIDHADLMPHLDEMKRSSRFGRRRAKTTTPAPTTTPETPTK